MAKCEQRNGVTTPRGSERARWFRQTRASGRTVGDRTQFERVDRANVMAGEKAEHPSKGRKRGRIRRFALIAATILIAGVWSVNWFRSFCFGVRFLTTIRDDQLSGYSRESNGKSSLGYCSYYLGTTRHCVGGGRELIAEWSGWANADEYPCFTLDSYRSNRYPYSMMEFSDSANWQIAGLGISHSDVPPGSWTLGHPAYDGREFSFPYWIMSIILAALWWRRWHRWRIHRRTERGGCPDCGYDLRGSPVIGMLVACPECGQATIATVAAA